MGEEIFPDVFEQIVILTDTVREVILAKHPEVSECLHLVPAVLQTPDEVRKSVVDPRTVLYYRYVTEILGGKWIAVVVKRVDKSFISTVYVTDKIKAGEVIWKK